MIDKYCVNDKYSVIENEAYVFIEYIFIDRVGRVG
jgi:hypothetical protein